MKRAEKRNHLINVAAQLFRRRGYNGVGVDTIIEQSNISKTTLYRHFPSKDDLIVAVLRQEDEAFRDAMSSFVEASTKDPIERIFATFDFLGKWLQETQFFGCPFIGAASEFSDSQTLIFREAQMHKKLVSAYFEQLAYAAGVADAKNLAYAINLLHEGAIAVAQISSNKEAISHAKSAARTIVEASL